MKKIGFPISTKENEYRRALIPKDLKKIKNISQLYFENGYGNILGYCDEDYLIEGARVADRETVLKCDIICDPKIGDAEYLSSLHNQTIFGWIHAVQNRDIADKLLDGKLTCYAWEDMFEKGRHVFFRNNEMAGEAAVMHAFQCWGKMPYTANVAILGRGNVANGALKLLTMLNANVTQYNRHMEKLFREELPQYDVIVNAILWDTSRTDHIIYKEDLKRIKKGALIIDISCDRNGGIETSIPTTINNPTYTIDDVMHYVVDHTPSLFYKTASEEISKACAPYIDSLLTSGNDVLKDALCIDNGFICDQRIINFQHR